MNRKKKKQKNKIEIKIACTISKSLTLFSFSFNFLLIFFGLFINRTFQSKNKLIVIFWKSNNNDTILFNKELIINVHVFKTKWRLFSLLHYSRCSSSISYWINKVCCFNQLADLLNSWGLPMLLISLATDDVEFKTSKVT